MSKHKAIDILKGLVSFDCERDLDSKSWIDDNPDEAEQLNERGIMASNRLNNPEEALMCFNDAIRRGNTHAMINGFTVAWSAGLYNRAAEWLKKKNSRDNKNIKCLWNEAMLWFYGTSLENNPLKRDISKTKELLDYILVNFEKYAKDNRQLVQSAYIFSLKHKLHTQGDDVLCGYEDWKVDGWQNRRNLAVIGNNLYYALQEYHCFPWDTGHYGSDKWLEHYVFTHLDELYLEEEWHLCVTLGDIHGFYVYNEDKKVQLSEKLRGPISKRAAWQVYLLYSVYRIMPLEDHDNYDSCRPIFTTRDLDLNSFATFMPDNHYGKVIADLKNLECTDKDIYPRVKQLTDVKFEVEAIWWNDWKGLFLERAVVEFAPKSYHPKMNITGEVIIYDYDCPVCI